MRVALTGGSGFTGRFVSAAIAQQGAEVVSIDADLCDREAVRRAVKETDFERLIHLAGSAFVAASDWYSFYAVNQLGTYNLLDAVAAARPGSRCVLASSAQVYGPSAKGLISEDAPTHPTNHYAISKLAMELGTALWRDRLEIVIARPFNYTGIGQGTEYLIPKLVDHFCRRTSSIELGNLWVKRDFGDVRAVAKAYAGLVLGSTPPPVVNIASGIVHSIDEIVTILSELSGHMPEVTVNPAFVRANDVEVLGGDVTRLASCLPDWVPRRLDDTLAWMYADQSERI